MAAGMVKARINADGVGYTIPNPVKDQPAINAAGYRGEVIEVSQEEYDRLRSVRVRVFYDDPVTGRRMGAFREEPSVVPANEAEAAEHDAAQKTRDEITALEDKLAEARNRLPLTTGATAPAGLAQVAASTAPRRLPDSDDDVPRPVTDAPRATAPTKPAERGR